MTTPNEDQVLLAKLAYAAYGQTTDFKNYQGNPMPDWNDLGDTIQAAWQAAAGAVASFLETGSALDASGRPAPGETGYYLLHDRLAPGD